MTGTAYAATVPASEQANGDAAVAPRIVSKATRHVRRGDAARVRGALRPAQPGRRVRLEVRAHGAWRLAAVARSRRDGRFRASWRPARPGAYRLRLRLAGGGATAQASRALPGRVYVYRPSLASWYGPGFYGGRTACGGRLGAGTLGVANKTLPCGARVTLRYGGRSLTVPVIDRGPYGGGREYDLTGATKSRLGFPSTGTVWSTR